MSDPRFEVPDAHFDRLASPKYRSRNPAQRALVRRFVRALGALFAEAAPRGRVLEVGCGEGFLSGLLSERFPELSFAGLDVRADDVARARALFPRLEATVGSAYELAGVTPQPDLLICAEVLEHLDDPRRALRAMAALRPRHLLLTVPHEPWFLLSNLARGKNVRRLGNDPEHVQHWTQRSFRRLLAEELEVVRVERSFPWLLGLARPR